MNKGRVMLKRQEPLFLRKASFYMTDRFVTSMLDSIFQCHIAVEARDVSSESQDDLASARVRNHDVSPNPVTFVLRGIVHRTNVNFVFPLVEASLHSYFPLSEGILA
jgi:hypothetical protein